MLVRGFREKAETLLLLRSRAKRLSFGRQRRELFSAHLAGSARRRRRRRRRCRRRRTLACVIPALAPAAATSLRVRAPGYKTGPRIHVDSKISVVHTRGFVLVLQLAFLTPTAIPRRIRLSLLVPFSLRRARAHREREGESRWIYGGSSSPHCSYSVTRASKETVRRGFTNGEWSHCSATRVAEKKSVSRQTLSASPKKKERKNPPPCFCPRTSCMNTRFQVFRCARLLGHWDSRVPVSKDSPILTSRVVKDT